jgi:hypothetical protein
MRICSTCTVAIFAVAGCPAPDDDTGDSGAATDPGATGSDDASTGTPATSTAGSETGSVDDSTGGVANACAELGWDDSWDAFVAARDTASGQYWYRVERGLNKWGAWPNCLYETVIVVDGGAVVRREIRLAQEEKYPDVEPCDPIDVVEEGADIGTTDEAYAALPWTLEQLYGACCDDILSSDPKEYYINFQTSPEGLMQYCNHSPVNCADSCGVPPEGYNGEIAIAEVGFGPPPPPKG